MKRSPEQSLATGVSKPLIRRNGVTAFKLTPLDMRCHTPVGTEDAASLMRKPCIFQEDSTNHG
jgi:hypothetical protein